MSTIKVVKCRVRQDDNELINLVAFKLAAKLRRVVTNKDVIHALLQNVDASGTDSADSISEQLEHHFRDTGE